MNRVKAKNWKILELAVKISITKIYWSYQIVIQSHRWIQAPWLLLHVSMQNMLEQYLTFKMTTESSLWSLRLAQTQMKMFRRDLKKLWVLAKKANNKLLSQRLLKYRTILIRLMSTAVKKKRTKWANHIGSVRTFSHTSKSRSFSLNLKPQLWST